MKKNWLLFCSLLLILFCTQQGFSTGRISGKVMLTGPIPKIEPFKCTLDQGTCGKQQSLDRLVLGKNRGIANTLIFIKNPPLQNTANMKPAVIVQDNCRFIPHIVIAAKGSSVRFVNKDDVLHNCHGYYYTYSASGPERTTAFNIAQPNGQQNDQVLRKPGMISVECDAGHTWMSAWIWVTGNPFATITDANGEYSFEGLPPGKYTIVLWHEGWQITSVGNDGRPIFSAPIGQEQEITVSDNGTAIANFELRS